MIWALSFDVSWAINGTDWVTQGVQRAETAVVCFTSYINSAYYPGILKLTAQGEAVWASRLMEPTGVSRGLYIRGEALYLPVEDWGGAVDLVKLGLDGGVIWAKQYPWSGYELVVGSNVVGDTIFVFGSSLITSEGFLLALDTSGSVVWAKRFAADGEVRIDDVTEGNNCLWVVGALKESSDQTYKTLVVKLNPDGSLQGYWVRGVSAASLGQFATCAFWDGSHLYVAGDGTGFSGTRDAFLMKLTETGEVCWIKGFGSTQSDAVHCLYQDLTMGVWWGWTGWGSGGRILLARLDTSGQVLWARVSGDIGYPLWISPELMVGGITSTGVGLVAFMEGWQSCLLSDTLISVYDVNFSDYYPALTVDDASFSAQDLNPSSVQADITSSPLCMRIREGDATPLEGELVNLYDLSGRIVRKPRKGKVYIGEFRRGDKRFFKPILRR